MKKYTKSFVPVFLVILLGSLTFIFAQTSENGFRQPPTGGKGDFLPPPPPDFNRGGLSPRVLDKLALTDAQKEQIHVIESNSRDASKEYFDKMRTADEQLRTLTDGGSFSDDAARQILSAKAQAMTEMELIRLRADAAIMQILSVEQKAQLAELKKQRPEFPPQRDGFRPGERPQN